MSRAVMVLRLVCAVLGAAGGVAAWFATVDRWPNPPRVGATATSFRHAAQPPGLDSIVRVALAGHPFRPDREPADRSQMPVPSAETETPDLGPPPDVRVHGVLEGAPEMAILSIGADGAHTLVPVGDAIHGITLNSIRGRTAELAWGDSTWTVVVDGGRS